jgi:nucleotide-binding universal stress UspA family protein
LLNGQTAATRHDFELENCAELRGVQRMEADLAYMDILALLLSADAEAGAIAAAGALANMGEGRPRALLFEIESRSIETPETYMTPETWNEISARAHEAFAEAEASLKARLGPSWTISNLATPAGLIGARAGEAARYAEVAVVGRPLTGLKRQLFEGALFGSGRPLIVAPQESHAGETGRRIVIAWNGGREAARAVAAATPLLERADKVAILTVVAEADDERIRTSPEALAAHLGRCGLVAEARVVERRGRTEAEALIEECHRFGADLIVMGGYGHARLRETVFGGLTRALLGDATAPALLMAH